MAIKYDTSQLNEILTKLLICGSTNARLNAAKECLKQSILLEEAQFVLKKISKNGDVMILSLKASKILNNYNPKDMN